MAETDTQGHGSAGDPVGSAGAEAAPTAATSGRILLARSIEVVGLGGGSLLVAALLWQWLDVYLMFFGQLPEPTASDWTRYVVTATACVSLVVLGMLTALAAGHVRVATLGVVVLVVALAAASGLAVPSDRFDRDPVERPGPAYEPCFSGSGDCVGG